MGGEIKKGGILNFDIKKKLSKAESKLFMVGG